MNQALAHAKRKKTVMAIMFLDLDHFKDVNDTLGHRTGDILLFEVASRISSVVRDSDTVARLGGDEFTVFAQDVGSTENAVIVAQKLLEIFSAPFDLEEKQIFITCSIGITLFPLDGDTVDDLLMNADVAMYQAKENGKDGYRIFNRDMVKKTSDRVTLQSDLRNALSRGEIFLQYQPKTCLKTGKVSSVEALIRWKHPEKGLIPPDRFIPLAEDSGLIGSLTEWVMNEACMQAKKWEGVNNARIRVAVNMSGYHFKRQDVIEMVTAVLEKTKLDPELLEIEITESSILQNNEYTLESLRTLKEMGITVSIDDFGTGYSSLSYLHRFPINTLKIDRSFTWNMTKSDEDRSIVTAIIAMAKSLKMHVVAEGVETVEQLQHLRMEGCDEIQGYLVSRPANADEVVQFFSEKNVLMQF
jgi:diguanylate cyclase (GGDEF)-like protein